MIQKLVLLYGEGPENESGLLLKETLDELNIEYSLISWPEVLANSEKVSHLDSPETLVRMCNPWVDLTLQNNYFSDLDQPHLTYGEFGSLMGLVRKQFPTSMYNTTPETATAIRSKERISEILERENISHPKKYEISSAKDLEEILQKEGDVFSKPVAGTEGKGTALIKRDRSTGEITYNTNESTSVLSPEDLEKIVSREGMIYQTFIDMPQFDGRKFDLRYLCVNGETEFVYGRLDKEGKAEANKVATNVSLGAEPSVEILNYIPSDKLNIAREMAERTARVLDMDYVGVDVVFDKEFNPYILEANAFPGVRGPLAHGSNPFMREVTENYLHLRKKSREDSTSSAPYSHSERILEVLQS